MEVCDGGVDGFLKGILLRAARAAGCPYREIISVKRMVDTGDGIQEAGKLEEGDVEK